MKYTREQVSKFSGEIPKIERSSMIKPTEVSLDTVTKEKEIVIKKMREAVNGFTEKTGLCISGVDYSLNTMETYDGDTVVMSIGIKLTVKV